MDVTPFEDIGLTNAEIKAYIALLELGITKVGAVIEKSGLQSSVVHNCLHKLQEKGLVSYMKKGQIKHYKATDPNNFVNFIDEKKRNFKKILPELLLKQKLAEDRNEAVIYEGWKGVMNMIVESIKNSKKGDEYLFFSADIKPINQEIQDFFRKFDPKRKAKGLIVKGIALTKLRHLFEDRVKRGFMQMKYSEQPIPPNMSICNDNVALFNWGEKPVAYLIYSKQLAEKYRNFFYSIWDSI